MTCSMTACVNVTDVCRQRVGVCGVEGGREAAMVALSRRYSFSIRDKILTGPPPAASQRGRRRSSGFLEYVGKRVSLSLSLEHTHTLTYSHTHSLSHACTHTHTLVGRQLPV